MTGTVLSLCPIFEHAEAKGFNSAFACPIFEHGENGRAALSWPGWSGQTIFQRGLTIPSLSMLKIDIFSNPCYTGREGLGLD